MREGCISPKWLIKSILENIQENAQAFRFTIIFSLRSLGEYYKEGFL